MSQSTLFDGLHQETNTKTSGPVTCLGQTFASDEERRKHFNALLREKLQDSEFRKIEGFPHGEDEDILNLSDPPYYTACPNPWLADFIAEWEAQKPAQSEDYHYHREPFAADVSEGKNHPIYNAHSYHTKVPHKAIMRYILHYTNPGDIVFDGFCGTGMTGVAAQMCGDRNAVLELGYQVKPDGTILQEEIDENGKKDWVAFSKLGVRRAILNDLSPAATFIAYNYNAPVDLSEFVKEANRILKEVEEKYGWMYETLHTDGKTKGKINYTVWSDVFVCSECAGEVVYWDAAIDVENQIVNKEFFCPHCNTALLKRNINRAFTSFFDPSLKCTVKQGKQVPVFINYTASNKRFNKQVDAFDQGVTNKIEDVNIEYWHPIERMIKGGETRRNDPAGITHTHHFYTKRNLVIISSILEKIRNSINSGRTKRYLEVWFTSFQSRLHKMNRYAAQHARHVGPMANTLYLSSTPAEISPFYFAKLKIKENNVNTFQQYACGINTGSASRLIIPDNTLDYLFVDPPFGANIMYSELNFLWESWLGVRTNSLSEAIENKSQKKSLDDYRHLMTSCFAEAYRVLKPGRWMTVEFSNTNASVWNSIQTALSDVGFIVAGVAALDKGRCWRRLKIDHPYRLKIDQG